MKTKFHILIVEDEKNILEFTAKALTAHEYKVTTATTATEALSLIASICPDIILLDLGLPDMDGMEVIKKVRLWSGNPIIVLSARTDETDKVNALDCGADDYITKPFGLPELLARIRTSLRHSNKSNSCSDMLMDSYRAKGLELKYLKRKITLDGAEIHLTPVEYKIVAYLAQNSGKVVTYSAIMNNVWGPFAESDNKILRVNMANIRRKLELKPAEPVYIFTEIGVGYRMLDDENLT